MTESAAQTPVAGAIDPDVPTRGPAVPPGEALRPAAVTLKGRFVTLGPVDPERDAAELYAATHGPGVARRFAYLFSGPFADKTAFAEDFRASAASDAVAPLTIREAAGERALGRASYMRIEPRHRVIEVGSILFGPSLVKTPGATEAMALMAAHVFEDLGYRRYEWKCDALNGPSRAAALRLGFRFEGIFSKHMIVKGHSRDTAWFAMTEDDWPAVKAAFEAWLAPDNFDGDGRQRRRLENLRATL